MDRGIALVFVICGVLGLIMTTYALNSRFYRQLSERYLSSPAAVDPSASSRQAPQ
jgi:MFS transporter, DHA3 family, multidrug efflux protein